MELIITTNEVEIGGYCASHAEFLSDYGSAPPAPAHPNCTRSYIPGVPLLHHPDGLVYLKKATQTYSASLTDFASDYGSPLPTLLAKQAARVAATQAAYEAQQQQQQQQTPLSQPAGGSQG